ncbi:MAG: sugar ABC transporter ATP-binding protein [Planctomyces sp.]
MNDAPLLEVRNVSKEFPGVIALDSVSLTLRAGEVLAVLGENGAGKSTLMKILAGIQQPTGGSILLDGQEVRIDSVRRAAQLGIVLIHQELNLSDNLTVEANISLGRESHRFGFLRNSRLRETASQALMRVGLNVPPETPLKNLAIGQQQLVEIARSLTVNARVLIMDEPTSSLSHHETQTLFEVVRELKSQGIAVVYISHRLSEVRELADRVVVLRDGKNAGEIAKSDITHDLMVRMMVGRDASGFYSRSSQTPGDILLEVDKLRTPAHPSRAVSFRLRAGEVVGIAGLVGAGRTELLESIFGIHPSLSGTISVAGVPLSIQCPADAVRGRMALVPEDRKQQGLVLEMSVRQNASLASIRRDSRGPGFINSQIEAAETDRMIRALNIRTPDARQIVQLLSGGNQQKVVLARWLIMNPLILMLDEPTRGIDVGARQEIYQLLDQLAAQGMAILFASSDMEEVLGISDRILVMHEGRLSGELTRNEFSEEAVMKLATGADIRPEVPARC